MKYCQSYIDSLHVMIVRITSLFRSIVFASWLLLRPILRRKGGASPSTPSARARARVQVHKSSVLKSTASKPSQPSKQAQTKNLHMETANGESSLPAIQGTSKLAEQATAKGELSYSYWAGKGGGTVPLPEPRKLTDEEKAELERQTSAIAASAWNTAGTFEEREVTPWAKSRLTELLLQRDLPGGDVTVVDVSNCEGEANIFIVRGKRRCGFDFELQLAWKAIPQPGATEVRGNCKVLNFASDDPDDLEVVLEVLHRQPERAADEAAALTRVRAVLRPELVKVLVQLFDELKTR